MQPLSSILKDLFRWFLSGLAIMLPLGATLILLGWAFNFLDQLVGGQSIFSGIWQTLFGWLHLGRSASVFLGYLFVFFIVVLIGYFGQGFAKQRLTSMLRSFFSRIPIVNKIYNSFEQVVDLWSNKEEGDRLSRVGEVVLVKFANVKTFGILSSRKTYHIADEEYYLVYLPSAPIPATGFTYFFKTSDVLACDVKMEDMTKVVVSLGVLGHQVLGGKIEITDLKTETTIPPIHKPE
ncbi:MAG: DUF502 domain-containing protein [bacterium]|nr:DUF502 domain-containing protein [bacterium]